MASPLVYTQHLLHVLRERGLQQQWVKAIVASPDWAEPDAVRPDTRRFYRALPELRAATSGPWWWKRRPKPV